MATAGKHKPGRGTKKTPVVGAVERGGDVTAKAVAKDKMKGRHMRAFVRDRIDTSKASLITDEYKAYLGMAKVLPHAVIKHSDWYVDGDIHTNTIEGFWALSEARHVRTVPQREPQAPSALRG